MGVVTNKFRLTLWQRLDGQGQIITGSDQYRPQNLGKPKDGNWRQVKGNYCCAPGSTIIMFHNSSANNLYSITNISTADNAINWTGVLGANGHVAFVIPSGYDETFNVVTDDSGTPTVVTSVAQQNTEGTATITAATTATGIFSFKTNVAPGAQFLITTS